MTDYKLGTGAIEGRPTPIVLADGRVHTLAEVLGADAPVTLEAVFADWGAMDEAIAAKVSKLSGGRDPSEIAYLTPIANPRKVICIGTNYRDHVAEMKLAEMPAFPYGFLRPPTSLAAHQEVIRLPAGSKMVDWEAEMGLVIGRKFGPGETSDPLEAVGGYTVINDISARDWIVNRPAVGIDWVMQKSWDRFQPTGPWITPARQIADPGSLAVSLTVNGVVKQQSNTAQLIFGVREIIRHLSAMLTLEPGDIIATGTPSGVGFGRRPPEFIQPGDRVVVTVEGLGTLENTFI